MNLMVKAGIAVGATVLFVLGLCGTPVKAMPASYSTTYQEAPSMKVQRFKLYGLNCTKCYLSIVRQVNKLPGVKNAHFILRTKTLVITGSGYSMKEVHRIVQSEKQRIVG